MGLPACYLPFPTAYDPVEDPPSSVDPLGTLTPAERIAEVLFPGLTARMWRPRLLTFTALASLVAERVIETRSVEEDSWLEARLGFERLFASAVIRQQEKEPGLWDLATRRLPGSFLARRALRANNEPLGRRNFLKGQAVNGPFGVMARLARNLSILDDDDRLGRGGEELLLAWSADEGLPGLLDDERTSTPSRKWLDKFVQTTTRHITKGEWMRTGWPGWQELAERLRPDQMGRQERKALRRLLDQDTIRARCLEILRESEVVGLFSAASETGDRGEQDHTVLLHGVLPRLNAETDETDRAIQLAVQLADAYEKVASLLETSFNGLLWCLTRRGGQARLEELHADYQLTSLLGKVCRQLPAATRCLRESIERIPSVPRVNNLNPIEPLEELTAQAASAAVTPITLLETIMLRHQSVQKAKNKGMWIERGDRWILMPGFGFASDTPPEAEPAFLHAFRIPNAYSFLTDLKSVQVQVPNEQT